MKKKINNFYKHGIELQKVNYYQLHVSIAEMQGRILINLKKFGYAGCVERSHHLQDEQASNHWDFQKYQCYQVSKVFFCSKILYMISRIGYNFGRV